MDGTLDQTAAMAFMNHAPPPPPPLVNQPPRIFGSEESPMAPSLMGPIFDDGTMFAMDDGGDPSDSKRRRIARACDMCRKKKIRCDGKMPACTHCQNQKVECVFTQVEKKRSPPKGAKYIEGLENRLGRMESLLRLSGLLSDDDDGRTDLGTLEKRLADKAAAAKAANGSAANGSAANGSNNSVNAGTPVESPKTTAGRSEAGGQDGAAGGTGTPHSASQYGGGLPSPRSGMTSPEPRKSGEGAAPGEGGGQGQNEEVEALSDMMCSLVTNNCGETRYIGSSSGFSIFSPRGIQWVNEKTGDNSFQDMISTVTIEDNKWIHWKPDVFRDIFSRRVFRPLPPKHEALSLLKDYFENFNCMFPLFHEPTFMHLVDKHYSRDPYEGSGWWASLNVALAIAHRLRVMSNLVPQEEDQKAWGYLKNALAVQTELTIRNTDLLSVQALLGMALFLMGTPNPQPSFFLVAAAIRLSHSIGLHKKGAGFNLNPSENEQRKRVFWIAYMLDRDICLRSGRPPIQDDDDMNVELPSEDPADNIGNIPLADGKSKVNLFRLMCTFAVIESKVYKRLYSVKAAKQSDGELLNTIGELDEELEDWKDAIPIDFRPEHEIKASHTPLILHVVVLHFAYYNCLTTIHRMSVHHGYWTSRLSNFAIQGLNARPLNPRVFSSAALCVTAARASIHLIKYIPQGDCSCVWLIIYYPVSALVTLFANILQNANDSRARSDLKLMSVVVNFLSVLALDEANGSVRRMLSVCSEFERIARVVVENADRESSSRRKRKQHQDQRDKDRDTAMTNAPQQQQQQQRQRSASQQPAPGRGAPAAGGQQARTPGSTVGPSGSSTAAATPTNNFASPDLGSQQQHTASALNTPFPSFSPQPAPQGLPNAAWLADMSPSAPSNAMLPPHQQQGGGFGDTPMAYSPQPSTAGGTPGPTGGSHVSGGGHGGGPRNGMGLAAAAVSSAAAAASGGASPYDFQQPFVPQDLWQMPMTLEWDWADMSGYPGFEDGIGMSGVLAETVSGGGSGGTSQFRGGREAGGGRMEKGGGE
ncbi:fungal-specific transcription factor domain-containing protein [Lineolata rhizophorae]|uniref:Fungal-specific transcription factor domain-containing protein n=1 Tax=Lineolata rhizophorae TaxID=578093 RepID=A0A6A6NW37_9PEZI|nr:fungal-specific transcription factor domain-containing protein [Lineolata rhizophorae]